MKTYEFNKSVRYAAGAGALLAALLFAGTVSAAFDPLQGQVHRGNLQRTGLFNATGVTAQASLKWKFQTGGEIYSSPVVVSNIMYVGSFDGKVYALDAQSGAQRWVVSTGDKVAGSAAVANGVVYIMTEAGYLLALNAQTGSNIWSYATGLPSCNSPAVISNIVYTMTGDVNAHEEIGMSSTAQLVALNATNGTLIWSTACGANGMAAVATDGKYLYAGGDGTWYAHNMTNGAREITIDMGHQARLFAGAAIGSNGWWYPVSTIRGSVEGVQTNKTKWMSATLATNAVLEMNAGGLYGYEVIGDPALAGGLIIVGCNDGAIHTFNATNGAAGWTFQTSDKIQTGPSVANNRAYFGGWDGNFYCVSLTNGALQWSYTLGAGSNINSSAWVADNAVYVGSDDGAVYCLQNAAADFSILIQTNNTVVPESGTNFFRMRLSSAPSADTTVRVSRVSGDTDISISGATQFVFTASTWSNWQSTVLVAANDADYLSQETWFDCVAAGMPTAPVRAVEQDDDLVIVLSTNSVIAREGGNTNISIKLSSAPSGTATVRVSRISGDTDLAVSGSTNLLFTAANWDTYQTMTFTAANDADQVNGSAVFRFSCAGLPDADLTVAENDTDLLQLMVAPSSMLLLEGTSNALSISLSILPTQAVVTVTVSRVSGDTDVAVSGSPLVFNTANWDIEQAVWIRAQDDADAVNGQALIRCSADGVSSVDVTVTERENDPLGWASGTTITLTTNVVVQDVNRFGINFSDSYYDSPVEKYRVRENYEGMVYRQMVKGMLCTNGLIAYDGNVYTIVSNGWASLYTSSASFELVSGASRGLTGRIVSVSVVATNLWAGNTNLYNVMFYEFDTAINVGATNSIRDMGIRIQDLGRTGEGHIGDTVVNAYRLTSVSAASDNPPGVYGVSCVQMDAATNKSILRYDTFWTNLATVSGNWNFHFWIRKVSGTPGVKVALDGSGETYTTNFVPSTNWQKMELTVPILNAANTVRIETTGGVVRVDHVELWKAGYTNPTAFTDDFVDNMRRLKPGTLRVVLMGGNTVSNWIVSPLNRQAGRFRIDAKIGPYDDNNDPGSGFHDFIGLCKEVDSEPWLCIPGAVTPSEVSFFVDYLAGPTNTSGGRLRAELGQVQPWTETVRNIHIEFGNEAWNTYTPYVYAGFNGADFWRELIAAGKGSPYYASNILFHAAGQNFSSSQASRILGDATNADRYAIAPYMVHNVNTNVWPFADGDYAAQFKWFMGYPLHEIFEEGMVDQSAVMDETGVEFSTYEFNYHTVTVSPTDTLSQVNTFLPSICHGLSTANSMLSMLKAYKMRTQTFFRHAQKSYEGALLWGSVLSFKKGEERFRPAFLAEEMVNKALYGDLVETVLNTNLQFASYGVFSGDVPETRYYDTLYSYAFRAGTTNRLVLINYDLTNTQTVHLVLSDYVQSGVASVRTLSAPAYTNNNETAPVAAQVLPVTGTVSFASGAEVIMAPFSMKVIEWGAAGALPRIETSDKNLTIAEGGTAQFQIRLDSAPAADVTVNVNWSSGDADIYVPGASTFTFTPANYADWQPVTLAADDDDDVTDGAAVIRCQNSEGTLTDVTVTEADDDFRVLVSKSSLTVPENSTNSFKVKLAGPPDADTGVAVEPFSGDASIYIVSSTSLVFSASNWSNWQDVIVGAADDTDLANGSAVIRCSLNADNYTNVVVTESDDDLLRLTLNADTYVQRNSTANLSTSTNLTAMYSSNSNNLTWHRKMYMRFLTTNLPSTVQSVSLNLTASMIETNISQVYSFEVYGLNDGDAGETWNPTTITWSNAPAYTPEQPGNWAATVTNVDVTKAALLGKMIITTDISQAGTTFNFKDSSPNSFVNFLNADTTNGVTFIVVMKTSVSINREIFFASDEHPALPGPELVVYYEPGNTIQVSSGSLVVPEYGTTNLQIRLGSLPYASLTVTTARVSGDTDLNVDSGASLVFTTNNWDQWQTVVLSAAGDADSMNGSAVFRCTIPNVASNELAVTELDADSISFVISTGAVQVVEGQTNQFFFRLSDAPTSSVSVTLSRYSGSTNILLIGTTQFVFTADNWDAWVTGRIYSAYETNLLHDTATVVCAASGGMPSPIYVGVTQFDIDARHITPSTNAIAFTYLIGNSAPAGLSFSVMNTGGGTMNYSVATNTSWLTVTPSSVTGLGSGTVQVHVLSIRTNGLVPGVSNAVITITSGQADNSPQTVSVAMTVDYAPVPVLSVSPTNLHFTWSYGSGVTTNLSTGFEGLYGTNMPAGWTQIRYGNTNWYIKTGGYNSKPSTAHGGTNNAILYTSGEATNLLITPAINFGSATSAVLNFWHAQSYWSGDQDDLTVQYRTNSSSTNWVVITKYTNNITAWTNRSLALPALSMNYQVAFKGHATYGYGVCLDDIAVVSYGAGGGGTPAPQSVTVSNSGYGLLMISNVWPVSWLSVQPVWTSGLAHGQSALITVSVSSNGLFQGTNTTVISVTSTNANNAPASVRVVATYGTNGTMNPVLTVNSPNGTPLPSGTASYSNGSLIACSAGGSPVTTATIQATCTGWTMTGNTPASGSTTNFSLTLTNSAVLTWNWSTNVLFTRTAGVNGQITGSTSGWYALGGSVTVTAVPNANCAFAGWSGDVSGDTNSTVMTLTMDRARSITASFTIAQKTLTVGTPYGTAVPGTVALDYGTSAGQNLQGSPATVGSTQYVCAGAVITGNGYTQVSPTNVTFTLTNNAVLTWLWTTNVQFSFTADNGSVSGSAPGWYALGGSVTVTAAADAHYHFAGWSGDVSGNTNSTVMTLTMDRSRSLTANFAIDQNTLTVTTPYGTAVPGTVTAGYNSSISQSVSGSPVVSGYTSYVCTGWTMTGNSPVSGSGTNVTLTLTNNAVLTWLWTTNVDYTYLLPWQETFENDGTNAGILGTLNGQHGWTATPSAAGTVLSSGGYSNSQCARVTGGRIEHAFSENKTNVWVKWQAQPVFGDTNITFATNVSVAFWVDTNGYVMAYSNASLVRLSTVKCQSAAWNEFMVYMDYGTQRWDLKVNGTNAATGLGFYSTQTGFKSWTMSDDIKTGLVDQIVMTLSDPFASVPEPDTDGDGIPDAWETQYFGGATNANPSATASNHVNTVMECYIAGLNPIDSNSILQLTDLRFPAAGTAFRWQGVSGRVYTVYWSSNLLSGFQSLQSNVPWTGNVFTDAVHGASSQGFYKLKVKLQ